MAEASLTAGLHPAARPRDTRLDAARGAAIVLVVLGHALIGVMAAGTDVRALRFLLILIYTSHVALFFLISGLLSQAQPPQPWPVLMRQLRARVILPYLLWGFVLYSAHSVMRDVTNTPLEPYAPWRILWRPPGVMWFLPVLGLGLILHRLLRVWGRIALGLGGALTLLAPYLVTSLPQELRFVGLVPLAALLGQGRATLACVSPVLAGAGLVMVATAGLAWADAAGPLQGYPAFAPAYLPALLAGPLLMFWMVGQAPVVAAILGFFGQHSMAIFVTHVLITAGVRIGLTQAGVDAPGLAVGLGTVLGVTLPLMAGHWVAERGFGGWLGWR